MFLRSRVSRLASRVLVFSRSSRVERHQKTSQADRLQFLFLLLTIDTILHADQIKDRLDGKRTEASEALVSWQFSCLPLSGYVMHRNYPTRENRQEKRTATGFHTRKENKKTNQMKKKSHPTTNPASYQRLIHGLLFHGHHRNFRVFFLCFVLSERIWELATVHYLSHGECLHVFACVCGRIDRASCLWLCASLGCSSGASRQL